MSMKPRLRIRAWYLVALLAGASFCAASVGYATGARQVPRLVLEPCGERQ